MTLPVLVGYAVVVVAGWALRALNLRHLATRGDSVPPELDGAIDTETLRRTSAYTLETSRLDLLRSVLQSVLMAFFLFAGWMGAYDGWVAARSGSFVGGGLVFFLLLFLAEGALEVPFSLYRNFRIESRYGFNTMTARLWASDLVKSTAISALVAVVAVASALWLVEHSPQWWWLWVWAFFLVLSLFLMYVSPYVIEPLFIKLRPLQVQGLEEEIRTLATRAGLEVRKVLQVDASRRSRHSNAYFTGFGKVKRIVLFDTLLAQMTPAEILAVLAHEAGHWKMRHVMKKIVLTEVLALAALFVAHRLVYWGGLPSLVGLAHASFYARAVIVAFLATLVSAPLTPLASFLSRRDEWAADRFARHLTGGGEDLARALVKLARDNLSNLHPHPLYAWAHYSHPPVVERIRALGRPERETGAS